MVDSFKVKCPECQRSHTAPLHLYEEELNCLSCNARMKPSELLDLPQSAPEPQYAAVDHVQAFGSMSVDIPYAMSNEPAKPKGTPLFPNVVMPVIMTLSLFAAAPAFIFSLGVLVVCILVFFGCWITWLLIDIRDSIRERPL